MASSSKTINPLRKFVTGNQPATLDTVAKLLSSSDVRNVVVLAGAGISTAAGIPDFRSPETGLYANLAKYNLPYAEAIFDITYFHQHPQPFFTLSRELYPGNFSPTLTHYFFRLLNEKKKLRRVFTQNIDTLERLAGLDADRIVEAHGSFATSRCTRCGKSVDADWIKDKCAKGEVAYHEDDEKCKKRGGGKGGLVKPDIVFFGEGLPERFFGKISDLSNCDLLIVLGTSLQVQPFASLIDRVPDTCPRLLINLEKVGEIGDDDGSFLSGLTSRFREDGFDFAGRGFKDKTRIRDVFFQGKADDGVRELARGCGWEEELDEMFVKGQKQFKGDDDKEETQDDKVETSTSTLSEAKQEADKIAKQVSAVASKEGDDNKAAEDKQQDTTSDALSKGLEKLGLESKQDEREATEVKDEKEASAKKSSL